MQEQTEEFCLLKWSLKSFVYLSEV